MNTARRLSFAGFRVAFLLLAATLAPSAHAEARLEDGAGLDLRLFRPPVDPDGYLSVNGTAGLPHQLGLRLTLDAGFGLVKLRGFRWSEQDSAEQPKSTRRLVDSAVTGVLALNFGLLERLVLGIALPVQYASGPSVLLPGTYNDRAERAPGGLSTLGAGDLELSGKYSLLTLQPSDLQSPAVLGLASVLRVSLPTGNASEFRGAPGLSVWPSVVAEYAPFQFLRFGVEAGYRFISGKGAVLPLGGRVRPVTASNDAAPNLRYTTGCDTITTTATCPGPMLGGQKFAYDDLVTLGIAAKISLNRRFSLLADWYLAGVAPALLERGAISGELALGARYQLNSYVSITAGGALGAPRGLLSANGRGFLSLIVAPAEADLDGDGYPTRSDGCPDQAEDFDGFRDSDGCPDADNDSDSIDDVVDQCPNDPGTLLGAGCPVRALGDRDGDGVNDYRDACPQTAAPGTPDGCPSPARGGVR